MATLHDAQPDQRRYTYLVGIHVTHSIAPPMHNHIATSLNLPWTFLATECPTVDDAMHLFHQDTFAGGVVTMPYKTTIMRHLDGLDDFAVKIGACNCVYRAKDGSGAWMLRGTNTDWRGIYGCLTGADGAGEGKGKAAMIVGAGGASRAAVYALHAELMCNPIYVVNRDEAEVQALLSDAKAYGEGLNIVHVKSANQAEDLISEQPPYYIVGTVPDFEAKTEEELEARRILEVCLKTERKGVLLDMCFKPRRTRNLKMGEQHDWRTVEGTGIIGHQIEEQYRLWCGEANSERLDVEGAWRVLMKAADESPSINF